MGKENIPLHPVTLRMLLENNPGIEKFEGGKTYFVGKDGTLRKFITLPQGYRIIKLSSGWVREKMELLGEGSFGKVCEAHRLNPDELLFSTPLNSCKKKTERVLCRLTPLELSALAPKILQKKFAEALDAAKAPTDPKETLLGDDSECKKQVKEEKASIPPLFQAEREKILQRIGKNAYEADIDRRLASERGMLNPPSSMLTVNSDNLLQGEKAIYISSYGTFYEGTTLSTCTNLDFWQKIRIMYALLEDLVRFQKLGIVHLDIKPDNIIVNLNGKLIAVFIDYGCSEPPGSTHTWTGTSGYIAPEILKDYKSDIYSLGITLLQMFNDDYENIPKTPMDESTFATYLIDQFGISPKIAYKIAILICAMSSSDLAERPSCHEALAQVKEIMEFVVKVHPEKISATTSSPEAKPVTVEGAAAVPVQEKNTLAGASTLRTASTIFTTSSTAASPLSKRPSTPLPQLNLTPIAKKQDSQQQPQQLLPPPAKRSALGWFNEARPIPSTPLPPAPQQTLVMC